MIKIITLFMFLLLAVDCYALERKLTVITVIIDPQYGGKAFGPTGNKDLKAKDMVLDIAKEIRSLFKDNESAKIVLTRDDDSFIPQDGRSTIAKRNKGDLFISIGINGSDRKDAKGMEIFYFDNYKKSQVKTDEKSDLKGILRDLIEGSNLAESISLANMIHNKLTGSIKMKDRGVRHGEFAIFRNIEIPSVLIMVGFITNKEDEARLMDGNFRQNIATAIYEGIIKYIKLKEDNEKEQEIQDMLHKSNK